MRRTLPGGLSPIRFALTPYGEVTVLIKGAVTRGPWPGPGLPQHNTDDKAAGAYER